MLKLKFLLPQLLTSQAELAVHLQLSQSTIAQIVNHNVWPRKRIFTIKDSVRVFLAARGADAAQISTAFEKVAPLRANEGCLGTDVNPHEKEDEPMLLRKQILLPSTRSHFELPGDPFDEVTDISEVYVNDHTRFVRATLLDCARRGGFIALVGESGSGKTTLKRDLKDRIATQGLPILVIEPYVLAMEEDDNKGKSLKSADIVTAIMAVVAQHERAMRSSEARFRQLNRVLCESNRAGQHHVLIIEEAHSLPLATLKHLKRFLELEDGFKRLLSIILIGQTELAMKLNEQNAAVREVVQRCELITLPPLGAHLEQYLAFRLNRYEISVSKIITTDGLQAITERLQPVVPRGHKQHSLLYPLAVHNLLIAAMNLAAENGAPVVSADIVQEV